MNIWIKLLISGDKGFVNCLVRYGYIMYHSVADDDQQMTVLFVIWERAC